MDLTDLPNDLFLLVVAHLSGRTVVSCRRVSKGWNVVFTAPELCLQLLKDHFPRCRELRLSYTASGGDIPASSTPRCARLWEDESYGSDDDGGNDRVEGHHDDDQQVPDWASIFAVVARRYHHLRTATPRSISKLRLGTAGPYRPGSRGRFFPISEWHRQLQLNGRTAPFISPDPSWCYSQELGLLLYHVHPDDVEDTPRSYVYPWRLLDLESGGESEVAFPHDDDRIVRRVRLAEGVLVFEWCQKASTFRNDVLCHKHYVTALDVVRVSGQAMWDTIPRAEFFLLDMPIAPDYYRFLSTHTATHYAVFSFKVLTHVSNAASVWDISSSTLQPRLVRTITGPELVFYGIGQCSAARLRELGLDARNLYFIEEAHRWEARRAPHIEAPPRAHFVKSTGVPVIPGPELLPLPSKDDNKYGICEPPKNAGKQIVVEGPRWRDECGADGDANLSFCTRVDQPPPHPEAGASSRTNGSPGIWNGSLPAAHKPNFTQELDSALSAPHDRWPGWAPCWRHEDFPYLTVSEMVDFKAGVRIVARSCFMLETLSVHVRPSLLVRSPGVAAAGCSDSLGPSVEASMGHLQLQEAATDGADGEPNTAFNAAGQEVQFADELWDQFLGHGYICGDERWLIGEGGEDGGTITILRF